jgi:hypothetical protein
MAGGDRDMDQMLHARPLRNPRDKQRLTLVAANAADADTAIDTGAARTIVDILRGGDRDDLAIRRVT